MTQPEPVSSQINQPSETQVTFWTAAQKPWVTYALMGLTLGFFLFQMLVKSAVGEDLIAFLGAKINERILQGEIWRLITPVLVHASLVHVGINMYSLYILGRMLEEHYGHGRFFVLYCLGALAGNVVSLWMSPGPSFGSATGLFALVAAQGVFVYQNRFLFGEKLRSILMNIALIIAINFSLSLFIKVELWGLVGGLMGGLGFSWLGGPIYGMIGKPPQLILMDQRSSTQVWRIGSAVLLFTILFAALRFVV